MDIHALSPSVATSVFEHGVLLVGDETHANALRHRVANANSESQSPRDRFDTALAKIDEHLGGSAVTATERSSRER